MDANVFGYDTLRKNPQDSFRHIRKIVNCNEIPIGISAAMDYSRCCTALLFNFLKVIIVPYKITSFAVITITFLVKFIFFRLNIFYK